MASRRRNARGESTLKLVLQETANLVSQYGYDGTTIARITRATGKSASSIYWSFDTKDELIAAALEATYQRGPEDVGGWFTYRTDTDLTAQLTEILEDEFTSHSTEAPVRLGLMVALESNAPVASVQAPLKSRRKRVREKIYAWWQDAANHHDHIDPEFDAQVMSKLTLAFLDGHYISDHDLASSRFNGRSDFIVKCLVGTFVALGKLEISDDMRLRQSTEASTAARYTPGPEDLDLALLHATRDLVAEKGYEGATLARICERSGVQRSSVYWRYKDKDTLIQIAVAGPFLELLKNLLPLEAARPTDWQNQLSTALAACIHSSVKEISTVRAGLLMKLQHRQPATMASVDIQKGLSQQLKQLESWINSGIDSTKSVSNLGAVIAWATSILAEGLLLGLAFNTTYDIELLPELYKAMLLEAVSPPEPTEFHEVPVITTD